MRIGASGDEMKKQDSQWSSTKARLALAALLRNGWCLKRPPRGSHHLLSKPGWPDYTFAYHDSAELGPVALKLMGKKTGLRPRDL
jgi:predicted RNA binding protein YcfA (HicA-like mRNA interferase family)